MSDIYTFYTTPSNNKHKFEFNQEFHDKIIDGYVMHKITIYFEKEITSLDNKNIFSIGICHYYQEPYLDTYEYLDNKISYILSNFEYMHFDENQKVMLTAFYHPENIIKSVEVELKKYDINVYYDKFYDHEKYCIIQSNYFKSFDEIIKYIMDDSGMNYELSKKYLIYESGLTKFYNGNPTEYDHLTDDYITLFEGDSIIINEDNYNGSSSSNYSVYGGDDDNYNNYNIEYYENEDDDDDY